MSTDMTTPMTTPATRLVWPGRPFPLGATWDGHGTNFALFSENSDHVQLCLFDDDDREEQIDVPERTAHVWHCYLPGVAPGQRYGFRVHGAYSPVEGHRFNPAKLLIDPYAKAIEGAVRWDAANVLPYTPNGTETADLFKSRCADGIVRAKTERCQTTRISGLKRAVKSTFCI